METVINVEAVHTHTHTHTTLNNDVVDFHTQNKRKNNRNLD